MKTEDVVKLAKKHLASVNGSRVTFGVQQLIALIAEVRRQAMEEAAALCDAAFADANWNPLLKNAAGVCADTIRARLDSPSGKEEGK